MTTMPDALAARPRDERRGLPIPPVNVQDDGRVDFTVINGRVGLEKARARICGLCDTSMQYWVAFLGGPQSARLRSYGDPPMHPACAEAALTLCPHIAIPHHKRASDERHERLAGDGDVPTIHEGWVEDKPQEWVLYITRDFEVHLSKADGGGIAPVYLPRPAKTLRRFGYNDAGQIEERRD